MLTKTFNWIQELRTSALVALSAVIGGLTMLAVVMAAATLADVLVYFSVTSPKETVQPTLTGVVVGVVGSLGWIAIVAFLLTALFRRVEKEITAERQADKA